MKKNKLLFCFALFSTITAGNYSNYNYDSNPPIIVSTICGDLSEVKKECTPTNINTQNSQGQTALMHSCIHGSGDIFTFLMENNANIKVKDNYGNTALDYAIKHNRPEIIEFLLLSGANDTLSLDEALKKAAEFENINKQTQILFEELSKDLPDIDIIKSCIDAGADVNAENRYGCIVLERAAKYGRTEIVKLLIDAGADVNARGKYGFTALIEAAQYGRTEIAKLLIANGADVNARRDYDGSTALMYAAINEKTEIVKLLIDAGADIDAQDKYGSTAYQRALSQFSSQDNEIIRLLKNHKTKLDAQKK